MARRKPDVAPQAAPVPAPKAKRPPRAPRDKPPVVDVTKRSPGRPSKLTPNIRKVILAALREGLTRKLACQLVGISGETFRKWVEKGKEQAHGEYHAFVAEIEAQEAALVVELLKDIRAAVTAQGAPDWRAKAWIAERLHPDEYGRTRVEHTGKDGGPIQESSTIEHSGSVAVHVDASIDLQVLSDDELERLIEIRSRARGAGVAPDRAETGGGETAPG